MSKMPRNEVSKNFVMSHTLDKEASAELRRKPHIEINKYNRSIETATKATQTDPEFDDNMVTEEWTPDTWNGTEEENSSEINKTLADNDEMHQSLAQLVDENAKYKAMVEEANNFIQICRNLLQQYNDNDMDLDQGFDSDDDLIKDIK